MQPAFSVYNRLPSPLQRAVKSVYNRTVVERRETEITNDLVAAFFDSHAEYETYVDDFERSGIAETVSDARSRYRELTGRDGLDDVGLQAGKRVYAVIRKHEPEVVVETGVAHGVSTLCTLQALEENSTGTCYSIDLPYTEESEAENVNDDSRLAFLRQELNQDHEAVSGETSTYIPPELDTGWVVPDRLRDRWELRLGRSQSLLPDVLSQRGRLDLFVHDSEHTAPCQMFEYELAYEHLSPDGILLSHDIHDPFWTFADVRQVTDYGLVEDSLGYIRV